MPIKEIIEKEKVKVKVVDTIKGRVYETKHETCIMRIYIKPQLRYKDDNVSAFLRLDNAEIIVLNDDEYVYESDRKFIIGND